VRTLGIIGGSGVYDVPGYEVVSRRSIDTPYGTASGPLVEARSSDTRLLFIPRHGVGHDIPPHAVNYRANICAMKLAGAQQILSISAVGSLKEAVVPGHVVVVDQYIDWTRTRPSTFFEPGLVAHVSMADPTCPQLSAAAVEAAKASGLVVHEGGVYICIEGPQFSTRAESQLFRSFGASVIGMTAMPEAKLAREAELPYATVAFATDYDCWRGASENVSVHAVLAVLKKNASAAQTLIKEIANRLPDASKSPASKALQGSLITKDSALGGGARARLAWLLG
jgi:5'-methylthioadenosine phosphorylase